MNIAAGDGRVDGSLELEGDASRERCIHVSVQVGCSTQQQQPDLISALQAQHGYIGCSGPVRDALRPYRGNHLAVL